MKSQKLSDALPLNLLALLYLWRHFASSYCSTKVYFALMALKNIVQ